ncbi:unnamed protein product [Amaranthus hypochondriacus]
MASKTTNTTLILFLTLNITFFSVVSGTYPPRTCPIDTLKLEVCADVLNGLLKVTLGTPPSRPCCSLLQNLVDLDAAVCLCTALKANVLGLHLDVPLSLSLLLNKCGCQYPQGFTCP